MRNRFAKPESADDLWVTKLFVWAVECEGWFPVWLTYPVLGLIFVARIVLGFMEYVLRFLFTPGRYWRNELF